LLPIVYIKQLESGKPLKSHKPATKPGIVVALGRRNGAGTMFGWVFGANVSSMKTKDLFVGNWWGTLHAKKPKA
jgi:hypothetical protein